MENKLKASMMNVQYNIGTQININHVENYFQDVENVYIGKTKEEVEQQEEEPGHEEEQMTYPETPAPSFISDPVQETANGKRKNWLFEDKYEQQDVARTATETKRFMDFLDKYDEPQKPVNTCRDNFVVKAFVAFYRVWAEKGWVRPIDKCNGAVCYRFLSSDCGLRMKSGEKTHSNVLRKFVKTINSKETEDINSAVRDAFAEKVHKAQRAQEE